jgi:hypothetical protein
MSLKYQLTPEPLQEWAAFEAAFFDSAAQVCVRVSETVFECV